MNDAKTTVTIGGAVLAALAASSCCIGPLVLAALGIGGAGAMGALAAYRPYLLGGTALLLAGGFYLSYRRQPACDCEKKNTRRGARIGLWIAVSMVAMVASAPWMLAKADQAAWASADDANLAKTTIFVEGISCTGCAAPIRRSLTKVGGFRDLDLDVRRQCVTVKYEPAPGRIEAYVAALNDLGYEARLESTAR